MTSSLRVRPDPTWSRTGTVLLAGSPLRRFRLTVAGARVALAIEAGEPVSPSPLLERLLDAGAVHPVMERRSGGHRYTQADVTLITPQLGG